MHILHIHIYTRMYTYIHLCTVRVGLYMYIFIGIHGSGLEILGQEPAIFHGHGSEGHRVARLKVAPLRVVYEYLGCR